MSERENVPGRVHIAVVGCTTTISPFPYSRAGSAVRTVGGDFSATRAGLGGVRVVHDLKNNASPRYPSPHQVKAGDYAGLFVSGPAILICLCTGTGCWQNNTSE